MLLPGKTNTSAVNIACYLDGRSQDTGDPEGVLPLPTGSSRLENLAGVLAENKQDRRGAGRRPGPGDFRRGLRPGRDLRFAAGCQSTNHLDLTVPTNEIPALDQVIAEMNISGTTEEQKLLAVQQFFRGQIHLQHLAGTGQAGTPTKRR